MLAEHGGGSGFDSQRAIRPSVGANTWYPSVQETKAGRPEIQTTLGYLECLNPDRANVSLSPCEANTTMIGLAKPYG